MQHVRSIAPCRAALAFGFLLATWTAIVSHADEITRSTAEENALKVAFIFNLAKFTQWPLENDAQNNETMTICVIGRIAFKRQLASLEGKRVLNKRVKVAYLADALKIVACQILFVGQLDTTMGRATIGAAGEFPILTISDSPGFAHSGGVVEIFSQDDRLRLRINNSNAERVGLKLSSKVLKLATVVD